MDTLVMDLPSMDEAEAAKRYGVKLGSGAYRSVYHVPGSRWAYKFEIERTWRNASNGANDREMYNFHTKRDSLPEGVDFPEMVMLPNGVIAVERVVGILARQAHGWEFDPAVGYDRDVCQCNKHHVTACWKRIVRRIPMMDLHGNNVMISNDGKIMIIDIGEAGDQYCTESSSSE